MISASGLSLPPRLVDINIGLEAGRTVALVGPNGAGKTTLLKTMFGLETPTQGTVKLRERSVHDMALNERANSISYLPSNGSTELPATVLDILQMGRANMHAIQLASEKFELTAFHKRFYMTLSDGEKKRVLLAKLWARKSFCWLLDEPLASLDANQAIHFLKHMRTHAQEQNIVVLASVHDLYFAEHYFDEVILMDAGKILEKVSAKGFTTTKQFGMVFREVLIQGNGAELPRDMS